MMKATGIVCELNPMHKGHTYLVQEAKQNNQAVVGVMSGPFVQRGEPAIMDKWDRARIAVNNGFDLIIELPQVYALQSAKWFAAGGIKTLSLIEGLDSLSFASEIGWDFEKLTEYQKELDKLQANDENQLTAKSSLNQQHKALTKISLPANAKLGLEYLRAIREENLDWTINVIQRQGATYHDESLKKEYPSATALRKLIKEKGIPAALPYLANGTKADDFPPLLPSIESLQVFTEVALILKQLGLSQSAHFEPGMDYRLIEQIQQADSLEEAFQKASNKKHSISRYRRLLITSMLGIDRVDQKPLESYIRPLAFNDIGRQLLRQAKGPVIQKVNQTKLHGPLKDILEIDVKAQALYEWMSKQTAKRDYQPTFYYPQ